MTPRPIHKWISLWLGLFVACFLAWAWRDSMRFETRAGITLGPVRIGIHRLQGDSILIFLVDPPPGRKSGWVMMRYPIPHYVNFDAGAHWQEAYPEAYVFRIRDAVAIPSILALWSAWLFCHWKRQQRRLTE